MQYQNHVQSLNVLKILEFFNLFLVTVQSAKVNLPKYRTPRDGHWTNQMTVKLSINNIYQYNHQALTIKLCGVCFFSWARILFTHKAKIRLFLFFYMKFQNQYFIFIWPKFFFGNYRIVIFCIFQVIVLSDRNFYFKKNIIAFPLKWLFP